MSDRFYMQQYDRTGWKPVWNNTMDQKMDFYAGMLKIGLNKGYSKGWAYYAYKEKFGVFPNKKPEPSLIPCDEAVRFAKYKQIRYSKSRK